MAAELLVIGTSGLAKEAAQLARHIDPEGRRWDRISYVAKDRALVATALPYGEVRCTDEDLCAFASPVDVVIGVGSPEVRERVVARLRTLPLLRFPNLVHPAAGLDETVVRMGQGNAICRGAIFTCDIEIGDFNWFNLNSTVGHDVRMGSCSVVNPGANVSGGVRIGDACLLGTGCQILEGLSLHAGSIIGAGAVITRNTSCPGRYVGMPARRLE